jgi:uncharacterized protein YggT (Ycf19 family)
MDDYERTTVRRDTVSDPVVDRPVATSPSYTTTERSVVHQGPSGGEMARRLVALLFGVLQALIILRIVLLLLIANRDNGIVAFILSATDPFVEPFRGMFRLDRLSAGQGSIFDVAAAVALIGWTLVEAIVIAVLSIGSRRRTETI